MPRKRGEARLRRWQNSGRASSRCIRGRYLVANRKTHRSRCESDTQFFEQARQQRVMLWVVDDEAAVDPIVASSIA